MTLVQPPAEPPYDVRHAGMFTPEQLHLSVALTRVHIDHTLEPTLEHYVLTDIWEPKYQRLKQFRIDIFIQPNLCVEVKGEVHNQHGQWLKDERRELWLRSKGYRVLCFTNRRVMQETDAVVEEIRAEMGR